MTRIAHVVSESAAGYATEIRSGHHRLTADEPVALGGTDQGPAPYGLLLSGLAACTSITLRMYAERKGWSLGAVQVDLEYFKEEEGAPARIERVLKFSSPLTAEQLERLAELAEKTPVTRTLKAGVTIETSLG
jgi:putative redox protein